MSVACWDGSTLAVDSRRITTKRGASSGGTIKKSISNDSVKITLPKEQVLFRREEVKAVARVGNVSLTKQMINALFEGRDIETYFCTLIQKKSLEIKGTGTLLIITAGGAWQFQINRKKDVTVQLVGNQPWSIGAGSKIAVYLMKTMHLSPEHAVSAIILGHSSCGGTIRTWGRQQGGRIEQIPDMKSNDRRMRIYCNGMQNVRLYDF